VSRWQFSELQEVPWVVDHDAPCRDVIDR